MFANHLTAATELFQAAHTKLTAPAVDQIMHANAVSRREVSHVAADFPPRDPRLRAQESAVNDQFWKCPRDNAHPSDRRRRRDANQMSDDPSSGIGTSDSRSGFPICSQSHRSHAGRLSKKRWKQRIEIDISTFLLS